MSGEIEMFRRLRFSKKTVISPDQERRKEQAEETRTNARQELVEARELASALRLIRERNHFADGFRKAIQGGHNG